MKLFLLGAALVAQSPDCPDDPTKLAASAVIVCAVEEARKLEPSGEPAGDIADATVGICHAMLDKVARMMNRCVDNVHFTAADFNKGLRSRALREVIEIRAKKAP